MGLHFLKGREAMGIETDESTHGHFGPAIRQIERSIYRQPANQTPADDNKTKQQQPPNNNNNNRSTFDRRGIKLWPIN
jgi:hypothetical protein